jgi:esterase/lipase superfamily enzyme
MALRHSTIGLLFGLALVANASQVTISGSVATEDGEALPGITVTVTAEHLVDSRVAITDEQGRFFITNLTPGEYAISADAQGFQVTTRRITATVGATSPITITMYPRLGPIAEQPFTIVRVHYGTNRTKIVHARGRTEYTPRPGPLSFGTATVSIPRDHRLGDWEQPLAAGTARQHLHVVLLSITPRNKVAFTSAVRDRVKESAKGEALVFVHGYNTSFQDAITRTALLAYDLKFDGAPIVFTWPSRAALLRYPADEEAAHASIEDLAAFLELVAAESGATKVHLIAHSMGNRVMLEALRLLQQRDAAPANLAHLILTAPDVNIVRFEQLITHVHKLSERTTLYASAKDKALRISKWFHTYERAGQGGERLRLFEGVDTIDVSAVDTSFTGHAYFGDNRSVVTDLYDLIRNGTPPTERICLSPRPPATPRWWTFDRCRP